MSENILVKTPIKWRSTKDVLKEKAYIPIYTLFFGWKFFNFIIIPKDFEIPYISEVEIILLLFIIKNRKFRHYIDYVIKIIINKLSLTNKFIILNNPMYILSTYTNYLNNFDAFIQVGKLIDTTSRLYIKIINNPVSYETSKYSNYLKNISKKNYNIEDISTINSEVRPISQINIKNIFYFPYLFSFIDEKENDYSIIIQKKKIVYTNYILMDLSVEYITPFILLKINNKNKSIIMHRCGGNRMFERVMYFLDAFDNLDLLNTFIIEDSYSKLENYNCIKKIFLYTTPLIKNNLSILSYYKKINCNNRDINELKKDSDRFYEILQKRARSDILTCDYIIDNKLKVNLDKKINLKKYFNDESILPLTFNIGPIRKLFLSDCEYQELFINSDYIDYIIINIIKFINNYCNLHKNKYFILKDANGSFGNDVTGFNCFDDYNKINYEKKKSYLKNLFYKEIKIKQVAKNRQEQHDNKVNILNKELIIQEFIQSPSIEKNKIKYNFKTRVYVIVYQQKSQNDSISPLYSYIYKEYSLDTMQYTKISKDNFYNESGDDELFISNFNKLEILSSEIDIKEFDFVPNEKFKEFINKFNIYINKINKFFNGIFIDDNNQFVNNNIYKILAIDVIFDINDNYNVKMLEINTD
jgi:hypothetical protein